MPRRAHILRAAAALLLGATTTLAAAWALARWREVPPYPRTLFRAFMVGGRAFSTSETHLWGAHDIWWMDLEFDARQRAALAPTTPLDLIAPLPPSEQCAQTRLNFSRMTRQRPGTLALEAPPPWGSFSHPASLPDFNHSGEDAAFGFPLPCLWYRVVSPLKGNVTYGGPVEGGILVSGQPTSRGTGNYHALPLRPIWIWLLADLALWTCCWWALLFAFSALRTSRRRRRGLCTRCAYDLRGLAPNAPCPECGHARSPYGVVSGSPV